MIAPQGCEIAGLNRAIEAVAVTETDESLQPNLRPLRILELFAEAGTPLTAADLTRESGLPRATVHRLLQTLEAEGYLDRDLNGRSWNPSPRACQLGWGLAAARQAVAERRSILRRLSGDLGESCNLSVPDEDSMRYVDRIEAQWPLQIRFPIGTRVPLHCTASGKMYLASLPADRLERMIARLPLPRHTWRTITSVDALRTEIDLTRARGFAEDEEEWIEGMIAAAAPIWTPSGNLAATVSFHAPVQRMSMKQARGHVDRLLRTAAELQAGLTANGAA